MKAVETLLFGKLILSLYLSFIIRKEDGKGFTTFTLHSLETPRNRGRRACRKLRTLFRVAEEREQAWPPSCCQIPGRETGPNRSIYATTALRTYVVAQIFPGWNRVADWLREAALFDGGIGPNLQPLRHSKPLKNNRIVDSSSPTPNHPQPPPIFSRLSLGKHHSWRKAAIASMREARRAGRNPAATATALSTSASDDNGTFY